MIKVTFRRLLPKMFYVTPGIRELLTSSYIATRDFFQKKSVRVKVKMKFMQNLMCIGYVHTFRAGLGGRLAGLQSIVPHFVIDTLHR